VTNTEPHPNGVEVVEHEPLPTTVQASLAFVQRLPTQRVLDQLAKLDGTPFGELQEQQPSRVLAFRCLLRDYPDRDFNSLWMHAYDVEVDLLTDVDPSSVLAQMLSPPSAPTTPA
jgi:hypothetical protein